MSIIAGIPSDLKEIHPQDYSTSFAEPTHAINIMVKRNKISSINSSIHGMLITCSDKRRRLSMKFHEINPISSSKLSVPGNFKSKGNNYDSNSSILAIYDNFSSYSFMDMNSAVVDSENDCHSNASILSIYDNISSYSFIDNSVITSQTDDYHDNTSPVAIGINGKKAVHAETEDNSGNSNIKPHGRFSIFKRSINGIVSKKSSSTSKICTHNHTNVNGSNMNGSQFKNEIKTPQIFSVTLKKSVQCSSQSINSPMITCTYDKTSHVYNNIPTIIVKCIEFLIPDALEIAGIFRVNGSTSRINNLQNLFELGPSFGQDMKWSEHKCFTIHDVSNILKRYLNSLEESIIPLELYNETIELMMKYPYIIEEMKKDNIKFESIAGADTGPLGNDEDVSDKSSFNIESEELSSHLAKLISVE